MSDPFTLAFIGKAYHQQFVDAQNEIIVICEQLAALEEKTNKRKKTTKKKVTKE